MALFSSFYYFYLLFLFILLKVPPKLAPLPANSPLYVGDYYQISCTVLHGDAPFNITWQYNGQPASELPGVSILMHSPRSSSLNIDSVQGEHAGSYTCMGANRAGYTTITTNLSVKGLLTYDLGLVVAQVVQ